MRVRTSVGERSRLVALTVVASNEGVSVLVLLDTIDVLLGLLKRDVHVSIETRQDP